MMAQMPGPTTVYIVCSDRGDNGKTLLARALTDHLLLEEHDPFCFDLDAPKGGLRPFFPGRTSLADFGAAGERARVFSMILGSPGRDYVIDLPATQLVPFCEAARARDFTTAAAAAGFRLCVLYVVDRMPESLSSAVAVDDLLQPDLMVPVVNHAVGSCLPDGVPGPVLVMEAITEELHPVVWSRRFSLRAFVQGNHTGVPARHVANLKTFMHGLLAGLREIDPALSLKQLRDGEAPAAKTV